MAPPYRFCPTLVSLSDLSGSEWPQSGSPLYAPLSKSSTICDSMPNLASLLNANQATSATNPQLFDWQAAGLRYHSYRHFLTGKFGASRVQKVSLDAGFTCPNVDGTVATGGCTFCDNRSFSPSRRGRLTAVSIRRQAQNILD